MLSTLAILLVYAAFTADAWLAARFAPAYHFYWCASAVIVALYAAVLRPHGRRWAEAEARLTAAVERLLPLRAAPAAACLVILSAAVADAIYRVRLIAHSPIKVTEGDMLPLLQQAVPTFLSGANPYRAYHVPWEIHLTYYPGLWLAYVPAEWLHVDYRYIGVAALLGVALVFCVVLTTTARRLAAIAGSAAAIRFALAAAILACAFLLNSKSRWFTAQMHTPPLWLYLALFCALAIARRTTAASLLLGVCCASRISLVVLAPFWVAHLWHSERSRLGARLAALVAPVLLLLAPFVLLDAPEFFFGTVRWYWLSSLRAWQLLPESVLNTYGLTSVVFAAGKIAWLQPLQLALLTALTIAGVARVRTLRDAFRWMNWALLAFSFTALVPYAYIYLECFLLLSFAVLHELSEVPGTPPVRAPDRKDAAGTRS